MKPGRLIGILVLSLAFAAGTAWLSDVPVRAADDDAVLRMAWRTPSLAVEECRTFTEAELAAMPAHMRRPEECTGRIADHELIVLVDGRTVAVDTLRPAGARMDRPVYVFRDVPINPGTRQLEVSLLALVPEGYDIGDGRLRREWGGSVVFETGDVGLVTLDDEGELVMRR